MLCFVCFVCLFVFLADFWDGHTASIGSFYVYKYFLSKQKSAIVFVFAGAGVYSDKKKDLWETRIHSKIILSLNISTNQIQVEMTLLML